MNFFSTAGRLISSRCRSTAARVIVPLLIVCAGLLVSVATTSAEETAKKYPFPLPPRTILERLGEMKLGEPPAISAEEWKVLDAAWALRDAPDAEKSGPAYDRIVVDALLTASGIQSDTALTSYREKLEKVIAGARDAVTKTKSKEHAGETLMGFLHSDLMKAGYETDQTSFSAVFDTGKYNCVSATAVYYVVGNALGLKMRLISVPGGFALSGHACLDVLDGERKYEVEPTNPDGFDWGTKLSKPGVFTIGYQPDRNRGYTIDALGLAAAVYSNRAVHLSHAEKPDRLAAASLGLRAAMVSPYDDSTTDNVIAVFTNWGPEVAKEGRYDEALRALSFGYKTTGSDKVRHNLSIISSDNIAELIKAKKDREAQAVIEQAAVELPQDPDFQEGRAWDRFVDRCYRDESGDAALAIVDRALATVPESQRPGMLKTRTSLFRRWSQNLLYVPDVDGSLKVLARGYRLDPNDEALHGGISYHVQEALGKVDPGGMTPQAAVAHYQAVRAEFPKLDFLSDRAEAHVHWSLQALCREKKFKEALAAASVYAPLAKSAEEAKGFSVQAWEAWGDSFVEPKDWTKAVEKYMEGLTALPNNERLIDCVEAVVDDWADAPMDARDWDAAIKIYDRGLTYLPNNGHLKHNREFCVAKKAEAGGK